MNKTRRRIHRCECPQCQQHPYSRLAQIHRAINRVLASLDERRRRQCAGLLARQYGRGGIAKLHVISGLSCPTIRRGQHELGTAKRTDPVRAPGGGRWPVEKNSPPC